MQNSVSKPMGLRQARMMELIILVINCIATVITTIFAALSYFKGKDKE